MNAAEILKARVPVPTTMSAAELKAYLPAELRARAFFSARNDLADSIVDTQKLLVDILSERSNDATARLGIKQQLRKLGYTTTEDKRGGLQDLSSDVRTNLIIKTNTDMAAGYTSHALSQDPDSMEAFPALELYRQTDRKLRRPWGRIWNNARDELGSATSAQRAGSDDAQNGMYALKNDPIWAAISEFGNPYPPFNYNSGMWTRDVSLAKAMSLGLIKKRSDIPRPQPTPFNDGVQADYSTATPDLLAAIKQMHGDLVSIKDGILSLVKK